MEKKRIVLVMALLSAFGFAPNRSVCAQSNEKRFEVGAQFVYMRQSSKDEIIHFRDLGVGGRFTFNIMKAVDVEAEMNFLPQERDALGLGRKTQGLFGVKAGLRRNSFGLFAKLRPGFMRFSRVFDCPGDFSSCREAGKTEFALDAGGVVEFYPSRRITLRVDAGDTIIHFGERSFFEELPVGRVTSPATTTHNLQLNAGIGFRF